MNRTREHRIKRRHQRVRRRVTGVVGRPRLCVHKSLRHLYAQIVDDAQGRTLCAVTTNTKEFKSDGRKSFRNRTSAKQLGERLGRLALDNGITQVVFDRGGYIYHGCVRELAEGARAAGLQF